MPRAAASSGWITTMAGPMAFRILGSFASLEFISHSSAGESNRKPRRRTPQQDRLTGLSSLWPGRAFRGLRPWRNPPRRLHCLEAHAFPRFGMSAGEPGHHQRGSTVPILRPVEFRNISRPPIPSSTVPVRRPCLSRTISLLPVPGSMVPVRRPLASRRISRFPIPGSIVPVRRPEASR